MKPLQLLFFLALTVVISCSEDSASPDEVSVDITASGLSDDKLPLNSSATFTANVSNFQGDPADLIHRWTLSKERGALTDGGVELPSPSLVGNSIRCIGKTAGDELILVEVLDTNNTVLGKASLDFTIVPPTDPGISRECFDRPKIIYRSGSSFYVINHDGSEEQSIGISGGLSLDISPDGEWIAWNDESSEGWDMWVQRCDGTERTMIAGGTSEDFLPKFAADSKTVYFLRPEPSQEKPSIGFRPSDIAAYEMETGEFRFLTTLYQNDERATDLTVSPITGDIAFFRRSYESSPDGDKVITKISFLQPETGLIRDFVTLPEAAYNYGLDWSPDGKDIIYSAQNSQERGIYRIDVTDGFQPFLIFDDPSPITQPPLYPHYYAGGTRIVWGGQENDQTSIDLWSIGANGKDMQQMTNRSGSENMQGVLH